MKAASKRCGFLSFQGEKNSRTLANKLYTKNQINTTMKQRTSMINQDIAIDAVLLIILAIAISLLSFLDLASYS
jgi:hypothetical protein